MSERTLTGHGGSLYARSWEHHDPSHVVVIAHGYGEHIGRYEHVAVAFGEQGAAVHGVDHVGHGHSEGPRAAIADFDLVADDLHRLVEEVRAENPGLPLVLVGHSMGGLIATRYAQRYGDVLTGMVLSAPLVGNPGTSDLLALDPLPEIPIDLAVLSRDEAVQRAYADDPLVYHGGFKRVTLAAMAVSLLDSALDAHLVRGPVLWQHGEDDELVPLEGSRRLIDRLERAEVSSHHYPGARHEIFNETNREEVLADTMRFIRAVTGT